MFKCFFIINTKKKGKYFLAAGGIKGNILQKKFYITIIDWKTSNILRTFQAHSNWINTLICIPFIYKGKMKDFIISGSADEEVCIWEANSGKLVNKVSGEGDRVVLHGMQFFYQEENTKKKFFLVSGGYHSNNQKNIFKVWV